VTAARASVTAAAALRAGEIVLLTTDTVPGLHALATRPGAADELRATKGTSGARPFLLLFADAAQVLACGRTASPLDRDRLLRVWPGPLTALLCPTAEAPAAWVHERRSIAVRVPAHESLRTLIREAGGPLFSTSANRPGQSPAGDLASACGIFPLLRAYDLGGGSARPPSTIVDLTVSPGRVVRAGAVAWPPGEGPP
jgi:L-threonylcarbamoyladenylate synthase